MKLEKYIKMETIKSVTHCPTCGSEVNVNVEGETHFYVPKLVIPYQKCPVCEGTCRTLVDGFTSSVYQTCKVCLGKMIIPMHKL